MNLYEALCVFVLTTPRPAGLRRWSWKNSPEAMVYPTPTGGVEYARYANAVVRWPWRPSFEDLCANDWEVCDATH